MSPEIWFFMANLIPMPWWLLMILLPGHRLTRRLTGNYAIFVILAGLYLSFLALGMAEAPSQGFGFEQIRQSLTQSELTFVAAWLHYVALDLFAGFWIYKEGQRLEIHTWHVSVCLLFTLLAGPLGLALFLVRRHLALPEETPWFEE